MGMDEREGGWARGKFVLSYGRLHTWHFCAETNENRL